MGEPLTVFSGPGPRFGDLHTTHVTDTATLRMSTDNPKLQIRKGAHSSGNECLLLDQTNAECQCLDPANTLSCSGQAGQHERQSGQGSLLHVVTWRPRPLLESQCSPLDLLHLFVGGGDGGREASGF